MMSGATNTILSKKIHEVLIISLIVRKEIIQTNCTWIKASQQEETTRRKALIVISQNIWLRFL